MYCHFSHHVGTSRVMTNRSGAVCYDAHYYPFGGRPVITETCSQNYKITGEECDGLKVENPR